MKSLDRILKGFRKTLKQLDNLIDANYAEAEHHEEAIRSRQERVMAPDAEGEQAIRVRNKISALVN